MLFDRQMSFLSFFYFFWAKKTKKKKNGPNERNGNKKNAHILYFKSQRAHTSASSFSSYLFSSFFSVFNHWFMATNAHFYLFRCIIVFFLLFNFQSKIILDPNKNKIKEKDSNAMWTILEEGIFLSSQPKI